MGESNQRKKLMNTNRETVDKFYQVITYYTFLLKFIEVIGSIESYLTALLDFILV